LHHNRAKYLVLGIKGAIMLAWFMTDVGVFVLGLLFWLWIILRKDEQNSE